MMLNHKLLFEIVLIFGTIDGSRYYHAKQSRLEMERQGPSDITYLLTLKYVTNEPIYTTENRLRDHTYGRGVGEENGLGI